MLSGVSTTCSASHVVPLAGSNCSRSKQFILSLPGIHYPFYAVQWHPEKAGFEWTPKETIDHSEHALKAMQAAANFFVSEGGTLNKSEMFSCVHHCSEHAQTLTSALL